MILIKDYLFIKQNVISIYPPEHSTPALVVSCVDGKKVIISFSSHAEVITELKRIYSERLLNV